MEFLFLDWLSQYDGIARIDAPFRSFASKFGALVDHVGFRALGRNGPLFPRRSDAAA
jgi:hypothetical protein